MLTNCGPTMGVQRQGASQNHQGREKTAPQNLREQREKPKPKKPKRGIKTMPLKFADT